MRFAFILFLFSSTLSFGADTPSTHGMLLFGEKKAYVSHLPMFHAPHDYQVILEIELDTASEKVFRKQKADFPGEKVFTLVPETFSLPVQVASGKSFDAEIYRGHFERGGEQIVAKAKVNVARVLHFRKFPKSGPSEKNAVFVFGVPGDFYSAHWIRSAPDFDRIVKVEIDGDGQLTEKNEVYFETGDLKH